MIKIYVVNLVVDTMLITKYFSDPEAYEFFMLKSENYVCDQIHENYFEVEGSLEGIPTTSLEELMREFS